MSIVFTNGCFDIIHRGHLELLRHCKTLGDKVIVGLNSDASIKKIKGIKRPINCESDRKFLLESLRYVDEVIVFDELTPYNLIKQVMPDLIVKGGDYTPESVIGKDISKVVIFNHVEGYSTTEKIKSIVNR